MRSQQKRSFLFGGGREGAFFKRGESGRESSSSTWSVVRERKEGNGRVVGVNTSGNLGAEGEGEVVFVVVLGEAGAEGDVLQRRRGLQLGHHRHRLTRRRRRRGLRFGLGLAFGGFDVVLQGPERFGVHGLDVDLDLGVAGGRQDHPLLDDLDDVAQTFGGQVVDVFRELGLFLEGEGLLHLGRSLGRRGRLRGGRVLFDRRLERDFRLRGRLLERLDRFLHRLHLLLQPDEFGHRNHRLVLASVEGVGAARAP
mmetsp:Transcript_26746/g.82119  ORF Transcript_26746/g.82119 Transcript_26746/m.82119 type:complete len:254 (-) Transcript_26746:1139-1900(-)